MADNTDFTLNKNNYATFDALTLKQLIKQRLNDGGVYTDQIFEGSNISAIIDIIAYSYHTLLFYLNNTASESLFSESTLYENMNRIVKLIDYNPTGFQTSLLSFEAEASENIPSNLYTIKRYSYFTLNGIYYSFNKDISFNKTTDSIEKLTSLSEDNLLRQGQYFEYPSQVSIGEDFEVFTVVVEDVKNNKPVFIDSSSFGVYVKDVDTGKHEFYTETNNIFLLGPDSLSYEKRLNENGFYEIKFGNGVFGKKLKIGDQVLIYYLKSDGEKGKVSPNQLNGNKINFFTTPQFEIISKDIYDQNFTFLTPQQTQEISFSNLNSSTESKEKEDVESIKINSKKLFQSQNRLVTVQDYTSFINKNFSNLVDSLKVVSNNSYIKDYIGYFYDLGLDRPNDDPRFLFNQLKFSTSASNNNVYMFLVPSIRNVDENNIETFLSTSQKNTIIEAIETQKMVNIEIIPQDPIYNAFNMGLQLPNETLSKEIVSETFLVVKRDINERVSAENLKQQINNIFINYFKDSKIGSLVSLSDIKNQILSLAGVTNILTRRVNNNLTLETPNISLLSFNNNYPEVDIEIITSDLQLPFFKYPFLFNNTIANNIIVEDA
tara:strand:+ start:2312 stop:4123 length:1812 start_codon:yes stop_codon:yes gene_type:complete